MTKKATDICYLEKNQDGVFIEKMHDAILVNQYSLNERTLPHKHDYYTCLFVEKGSIEILVDLEKITIGQNTLHILFPGQVHQFIKASPLTAYYLSLGSLLTSEEVRNVLEQSLAEEIIIQFTERESQWFRSLLDLMVMTKDDIKDQGIQDLNIRTIQALASSFIMQAASLYQSKEQKKSSIHSVNKINIAKRFFQLVRRFIKDYKRPAQYADLMNLSVGYLNDTVREVTGFSLSYFIQRQVVSEAQKLLYYSDLSVKEIAISLGYEDYKYFNRLFRKSTGIPPGEFRQRKSTYNRETDSVVTIWKN